MYSIQGRNFVACIGYYISNDYAQVPIVFQLSPAERGTPPKNELSKSWKSSLQVDKPDVIQKTAVLRKHGKHPVFCYKLNSENPELISHHTVKCLSQVGYGWFTLRLLHILCKWSLKSSEKDPKVYSKVRNPSKQYKASQWQPIFFQANQKKTDNTYHMNYDETCWNHVIPCPFVWCPAVAKESLAYNVLQSCSQWSRNPPDIAGTPRTMFSKKERGRYLCHEAVCPFGDEFWYHMIISGSYWWFQPTFSKTYCIPEYIGIFLNFPCDWLVWFKRSVCRPYFTLTKKCIWKAPTKTNKTLTKPKPFFFGKHTCTRRICVNKHVQMFCHRSYFGGSLQLEASWNHGTRRTNKYIFAHHAIHTIFLYIYEYMYLFIYGCMVCYIHIHTLCGIYMHGINMSNTQLHTNTALQKVHQVQPISVQRRLPGQPTPFHREKKNIKSRLLKGHSIPIDMNVIFALLTQMGD